MAIIGENSMLGRKLGPLPTWVWMALGLLVALAYSVWEKNKQASAEDTSTSDTTVPDQTPPVVFQNYTYVTDVNTPPAGGRMPPSAPPPTTPPPATTLPSVTPVTTAPPAVVKKPGAVATPAPKGQWVTVSKYTSSNPPWNSTLWGIAAKLLGNGSKWQTIWNDPQNAALKSRRKSADKIQPGDKIWVTK